jgi:TonB family protein
MTLTVSLLALSSPFQSSMCLSSVNRLVQTQELVTPSYLNTSAGLRRLLQDVLAAAKRGDKKRVSDFLKQTEIPNCKAWLHQMYDPDKADIRMSVCEAHSLASEEKSMRDLFMRLAKNEGEIAVRKVNDTPQSSHGFEWTWLHAVKQPLDIYFASWKAQQERLEDQPIGYFMFVEEGFRWESGIRFGGRLTGSEQAGENSRASDRNGRQRIQLSEREAGKQLLNRIDPDYPESASKARIEGSVRLQAIIATDGSIKELKVLSGHPLLIDSALQAVRKWKYRPFQAEGQLVEVETNVVVVFALK